MAEPAFDLGEFREALQRGSIEWRRHTLEQMASRSISRSDVIGAMLRGECIEAYPSVGRPFPDALFLGWVGSRPVHVVAAFDTVGQRIYVITVYEPDLDHFEPDFRTRRR